jgi:hypothetical protein
MPFWNRRIGLATAGTGAALLGFALGWWGDQEGGRREFAPGAAAEWSLPKPAAPDLSGFAKTLAQRLPFGVAAERASPAPAGAQTAAPVSAGAAQWRVGGIVVTETGRYLIILIRRPGDNAARSEIRRPGEELPDGSIVRAVEPSNVTIEREGTIVRIKMFAQN